MKKILNWISRRSLRQRYLSTALTLSSILLLCAYYGWQYVEQKSHRQLLNIESRAEAEDALSDVVLQVHTIENSLQKFITTPTETSERNMNRSFELFDSSINKLRKNSWIKLDSTLTELVHSLAKDKSKLQDEVKHLVSVRNDETRWLPTISIMRDRMLSHNMLFTAALDFYIQEKSESLTAKKEIETYKILNEIRYSWQRMISEFRLFISYGSGMLSMRPEFDMESGEVNVRLYIDQVDKLLFRLETLEKSNKHDVLNHSTLVEMRKQHSEWKAAYQDALATLKSEYWRRDLTLMRDNIKPIFDQIQQRSSSLKLELSVASAKTITELTSLARKLSDFVIILSIALTIVGVVGYFIFHYTILNPIKNFASALKIDASDEHPDPSKFIVSKAVEFRNLSSAFQNMHEQIRTRQDHLDHMAHHDALTQLPNRILLRDRLQLAISRSRRDKNDVGLMFLDLDRFKQINDSLGHAIGDQLLVLVAERLLSCVRATDTVSRLGGDEFAILIEGVTHADQVANVARKILNEFVLPFKVEQYELHSSTSIGIAIGPTDDDNVDALIKDADIAMYHAKELGRNHYKFYSGEMAAQVADYMVMENQLRRALENDEFFLHYQPIVDLKSGEIVGTEALLRWQHPEKGVIGPAQYLSTIEDSGLILPVTQWVLIEASHQYNRFKQAGFSKVCMSVNLSAVLLKGDSVLDMVINCIEQTKIDPSGLIMEITEDTLLEDLRGAEKALTTLKEMGIRIALDDFGTGQSSLSHLRLEPIDIVKIDREFIRNIPADENDMELVDAVIAMAHKLHRRVVAEGVETREQLDFLRWHKCDAIQGYYFSKPCEGKDVLKLLGEGKRISHG